jgi:hypothetical protein
MLVMSKDYHMIITASIHVNRMARQLVQKTGKYTGGSITVEAHMEMIDP